ncbi:putative protein N(5)-glutamine methyltransferase [Nocardioides sp. AE5]|uniref:putative protein N(5)-glutamine methyltransferase n=1 Tax=Nocardioides sp. AE5 TaxID=2962573 RepID=UPI00288102E1|nr:putative protein N(5)-glutamine methyltransferase [Nocardioides sp. AE5]MDT0202991.1 putative protein N(5)-glutamine methyltransferase [Nocardioides sp. AE5]
MTAPDPIVDALRAAGCVFAEQEAALLREAAVDEPHLRRLTGQRVAGLPLEYVVGWAGFRGLRVAVGPGVFVPRRRTEAMVDVAVARCRGSDKLVVVDLCCGSGALGLGLVTELGRLRRPPVIELHAADLTAEAARWARLNLAGRGQVHVGDLYAALPTRLRGRIDVLLANTPYVPTGEVALLPPEAREHEPRIALDGGSDGLTLARRVLEDAPDWLARDGSVHIEVAGGQVEALASYAETRGLEVAVADSVLTATRPRSSRR